jgi:multiple sugar transport system permease protein
MVTNKSIKWIQLVITGILLLLILFPLYWMAVSSLMPNSFLFSLPPHFSPFEGSGDNFIRVLSNSQYLTYFKNSFIVSTSTVLLCIFTAVLGGYSLSRFNIKINGTIIVFILSIQMFPIVAILISLYTFFSDWHLLNSYIGLVISDTTFCLPLSIILIKSFIDTVPKSLDEAAKIDGCGRLRILGSILLPTITPGILAVGIFTFMKSWDDFLFSLIIMQDNSMKTLPVGLAQSFLGEYVHDYGGMMALSVCAAIPILLLFIFFQKYMISGMTAGAVKG